MMNESRLNGGEVLVVFSVTAPVVAFSPAETKIPGDLESSPAMYFLLGRNRKKGRWSLVYQVAREG